MKIALLLEFPMSLVAARSLVLVLLALHVSYAADDETPVDTCPRGCKCLPNIEVSCENSQLKHLPKLGDDHKGYKSLDLSGNLLSSISVKDFNKLPSLELLDLSHNRISSLSKYAFNESPKLRKLHLENNSLQNLHPRVFNLNPHLKHLNLSENPISDNLPFLLSDSIIHLDISSCTLESLPPNFPSGLAQLQILKLSNNKLNSLPDNFFKSLPHLTEVHLHGNPWNCDDIDTKELMTNNEGIIADSEKIHCITSDEEKLTWSDWLTPSTASSESESEETILVEDDTVPDDWLRKQRPRQVEDVTSTDMEPEIEPTNELIENIRTVIIHLNIALAIVIAIVLVVIFLIFLRRSSYYCRKTSDVTVFENHNTEEDEYGYLKPNVVFTPDLSATLNKSDKHNTYVEHVYERIN